MMSENPQGQIGDAVESLAEATAAREQRDRNRMPDEDRAISQTPSDSAAQRALQDDDLQDSLVALSGLSSNDLQLEQLLTRVAAFAVRAIPGAEGAGLTLLEESRRNTIVTTAPFVSEVDDLQYSVGEGPCIDAAASGQTVTSGSLGGDPRWPKFGGHVARMGVHSVISLPLVTSTRVVGAMNVYAHAKHVFDARAAELGELYATPAAIAVQNAYILANAQRLADRMQSALETQSIIDQAIGILIGRGGGSATEARDRLRAMSQSEQRKLADVARSIVDQATRRARARRAEER